MNMLNSKNETAGGTAMQVFTYNEKDAKLRIQEIDGNPWFIAKDLCEILEHSNHKMAIQALEEDEVRKVYLTDSLGREQETLVVNESGMYALIFRSNKPEARKFRKWVTSEVLPSIRKTGKYEIPGRRVVAPRQGDYLDLRCEPYNTKWLGTTTVRVIEYEDMEWYSVADINRAMQVGTGAFQGARMLHDVNPSLVRKIFIFGNTHPAWFTTITGLRLLVSGSRKLKTRSNMLQLKEGGAI